MGTEDKRVLELVAKVARKDVAAVSPDLRIAEDLGVKSVGRIELAALLEDELGVEIGNRRHLQTLDRRHLRQKHRAELARPDQPRPHRPSFCRPLRT